MGTDVRDPIPQPSSLFPDASVFAVQVREAREKARVLHEERSKAHDEMRQASAHYEFLVTACRHAEREIEDANHALETAIRRQALAAVTAE